MKVQFSLLVAVAAFLAAGCSSTERTHSIPSRYPIQASAVATSPHEGNLVNCPGNGVAHACVIPITVRPHSSCNAVDIVLEDFVNLGTLAESNKVVWTLPAGFVFCPRAGDGVFLKDPNVPDDVFDPMPGSQCSNTFEWTRMQSNLKRYEYLVRFRTGNKICGVKDPWMQN